MACKARRLNNDTFRQSVECAYLPQKSAISCEGLFNEYFFETGVSETAELLTPSYSVAQTPDGLFMTVGFNSVHDGKNKRNKLNLVIVLDISGSMSTPFNAMRTSSQHKEGSSCSSKSKIAIASEVLIDILQVLKPDERIGIVLFNTNVQLLQPMRAVIDVDMAGLSRSIMALQAHGGTNMEVGMNAAVEMMSDLRLDDRLYENRIIFLTDAMPNTGIKWL